MPSTKTARTGTSAATNTAGSTTTGSVIDLTTKYGGLATVKITNGATGPTIPCSAKVYTSHDNSAFKLMATLTGDSVNASVNEWAVEIPPYVMYMRIDFTGNTAQSVTVEAYLQELTTI